MTKETAKIVLDEHTNGHYDKEYSASLSTRNFSFVTIHYKTKGGAQRSLRNIVDKHDLKKNINVACGAVIPFILQKRIRGVVHTTKTGTPGYSAILCTRTFYLELKKFYKTARGARKGLKNLIEKLNLEKTVNIKWDVEDV